MRCKIFHNFDGHTVDGIIITGDAKDCQSDDIQYLFDMPILFYHNDKIVHHMILLW